ncbi:hypothetical protein BH10PAT1_BH10PAT1_6790 [soil metagenome]
MNLKKTLKQIKLHETEISVVLGIVILLIAGIFVIKYVKNLKNQTPVNQEVVSTHDQTHKVVKGETLWSISKLYYRQGSDWKKIADANNIQDSRKIEIGQNLIIPNSSPEPIVTASPTPKPQITEEAASTSNVIKGANYTVVKGDNLWNIAVRAYGDGFKWTEIAKANNLQNPRIIHRGNVFILPR